MKKDLRALSEKTERIAGGGICLLVLVPMLILALTAFLFTTGVEIVNYGQEVDTTVNRIFVALESVVYYSDFLPTNILWLVVSLVACRLLLPTASKTKTMDQVTILLVWTLLVGTVWVLSSQAKPTFDSAEVSEAALAFARGDYTAMSGEYIRAYPFQLGYIRLCELIFRFTMLFGSAPKTFLILQVANVAFVAAAYAGLLLLAKQLFTDPRVGDLTFLLLLFCAQPLLISVFTYGLLPGICFAIWAIVFQVLWLRKNKLVYGLLSALFIGIAVLIKSNSLIVWVAMTIVAVLRLLKRKQLVKDLAVILAACFCAFTFAPAVRASYERRSGVTLGSGVPYIGWIAMGMSESGIAPGWYSSGTSNKKLKELNFNSDALASYSKQVIRERIDYFLDHPQYTRDFYYRKFVSQFNETTYQSIWSNKVREQYKEKSGIAAWVCGKGEAAARRYMDVFAQLVFVGMIAALLLMLRRREYTSLILPLTLLGGMMFHMMWEGKSQYILPYFMLMIPSAAWGLTACCDRGEHLAKRFLPSKKAAADAPAVPAPAGKEDLLLPVELLRLSHLHL